MKALSAALVRVTKERTRRRIARLMRTACVMFGIGAANAYAEPLEDIPNVLVIDKRTNARDTLAASKIDLPASDVPVSAELIDQQTIERTGFTNLGSLLQATSSVSTNPADGNAFNDYLLRGFANTPIYRNGINDSIGDRPVRALANIERIEVLKGPYGALYGPGEPGGSINFVTKKPEETFAHKLELSFGSFGEAIVELDSTGPLTDRSFLYRFIARREQANTFRDFVKSDRLFLNPMLSWQASSRVRFDASFEFVRDERLFDNGLIAINGETPLKRDHYLGEANSGAGKIDVYTFQLSSDVNLTNDWSLELSLNGQNSEIKGDLVEPDGLEIDNNRLMLERSATFQNELSRALVAQAELSGVIMTWEIPQHVVVGMSATAFNEDTLFRASDPDDNPYAIDVFSPVYGAVRPFAELERDSSERSRQFSIYGQDLLELGDRWRLLLGLRFDHIEQNGSDAASNSRFDRISNELSPRVGLVYKPNQSWSLFASYSATIDPNEGLTPQGGGLAPTKGRAVESGFKWQSARYPLSIDGSLFGIKQTNVTTDAPGNPGFELQTAEQESLGAEFEIRFDPLDWLSLLTRYSFVDAQILNDATLANGTTPLNVAKHQFSVLGLSRASLIRRDDVSLALSLNYLGERQGSLEPDELSFRLPGYFRGDVFITWDHSRRLSLRLGIENFTDEDYISGSQSDALHLLPGVPLTVRGQISLSF